MGVLEYYQAEPSGFEVWFRRARRFLPPAGLVLLIGTLGGLIGSRFPPIPQVTTYWKVDVPGGASALAACELNDNFGPSESFAPIAVSALRRAGLAQGETDLAAIRRIFLFVKGTKPGSQNGSVQVGFTASDHQSSERGTQLLVAEITNVLNVRGISHQAYSLPSWSYDDGGGCVPRIVIGAGTGSLIGLLVAFMVSHTRNARGTAAVS